MLLALRDPNAMPEKQLDYAVARCTMAAAAEFDIEKQKLYLSAASFGKTLTDRIHYEQFSRTNRILRVLNHLRHQSFIFITYKQFVEMGPLGLIERLLRRNEHRLTWHIAHHLQLTEENPDIKERIASSWAQSTVQNMAEGKEAETITKIRNRMASLDVRLNYIQIAQQAIELAQGGNFTEMAYKLIDCEPRYKPRVELLLRIDNTYEKALTCALQSHDPDLIYLCLIKLRKLYRNDENAWAEILKKYPAADRQYKI